MKQSDNRGPRTPWCGGGFTLVEILIVVVILGIMAAIVIPQFSNASVMARENMLKDELRSIRSQIQVYRAQHQGVPPGHPDGNMEVNGTSEAFAAQMTMHTNVSGVTSTERTAEFRFGPYLSRIPENPLTGLSAVLVIPNGTGGLPASPQNTDTYGWMYYPGTQEFRANVNGTGADGVAYFDY